MQVLNIYIKMWRGLGRDSSSIAVFAFKEVGANRHKIDI
jgi:hypothetical protein